MTTATLRTASPRDHQGRRPRDRRPDRRRRPRPVARWHGDVADAWGKNFASTLKDLGASAKVGEICKLPGSGVDQGAAARRGRPRQGRRSRPRDLRKAAGAAARALAGKGTVALALPADHRRAGPGRRRGRAARRLRLRRVPRQEARARSARSSCSPSWPARSEAKAALAAADHRGRCSELLPRPRQHAAQRPLPRVVRRRAEGAEPRAPASRSSITDEKALEAKGYGGILGVGKGSARGPRLVTLTYKPAKPVAHIALRRQGHHVRLRRPVDQAGQLDGDDEVRHVRGRRGRRGDLRDRRARPARPGDGLRLPGREHAVGQGDPARATCSRCTAARPSRCSTPTPRAGSSSPTASRRPTRSSPT